LTAEGNVGPTTGYIHRCNEYPRVTENRQVTGGQSDCGQNNRGQSDRGTKWPGDKVTGEHSDQGTKWPGTKWPGPKWSGSKCKKTLDTANLDYLRHLTACIKQTPSAVANK
jgi:hypothetical protein